MEWLRVVGFCLVAAVMILVLRQMHAQMAGLLAVAFGVLLLGLILPEIQIYLEQIRIFLQSLDFDAAYYRTMLKAMGIVLVTQFSIQICDDLNAPSVARYVEFCGRIALLGIAAPVFMELTQMAVSVLR